MTCDLMLAERIRHLLADRADAHEKKMMGGIAFMVKGGMCCAASGRGGLLVRVDPDAQPKLVARAHVKPMVMAGRNVKTFVRVSQQGYRTPMQLDKWARRGLDAVAALPAKSGRQSRPR